MTYTTKFEGSMLILEGPTGRIEFSQGQCAAITVMADIFKADPTLHPLGAAAVNVIVSQLKEKLDEAQKGDRKNLRIAELDRYIGAVGAVLGYRPGETVMGSAIRIMNELEQIKQSVQVEHVRALEDRLAATERHAESEHARLIAEISAACREGIAARNDLQAEQRRKDTDRAEAWHQRDVAANGLAQWKARAEKAEQVIEQIRREQTDQVRQDQQQKNQNRKFYDHRRDRIKDIVRCANPQAFAHIEASDRIQRHRRRVQKANRSNEIRKWMHDCTNLFRDIAAAVQRGELVVKS